MLESNTEEEREQQKAAMERARACLALPRVGRAHEFNLCILVYLVIYDSGYVSLEHPLLSWYPSPVNGLNLG